MDAVRARQADASIVRGTAKSFLQWLRPGRRSAAYVGAEGPTPKGDSFLQGPFLRQDKLKPILRCVVTWEPFEAQDELEAPTS